MRKSKFKNEQIVYALKKATEGSSVSDICREMGISHNTFYIWKRQFDGLSVVDAKKFKEVQKENDRLKRLLAELTLDKHMLQEVLAKKL
jgi:putative transposase